jgi:hypothetical protein
VNGSVVKRHFELLRLSEDLLHEGKYKEINGEHFQAFLDEINGTIPKVIVPKVIHPPSQRQFHYGCPEHV